jgi:hypothetical protein
MTPHITGPQYYREAERLRQRSRGDVPDRALLLAEAQVCATLALAAATALNDYPNGAPVEDWTAWRQAAGIYHPATRNGHEVSS